MLYSKRFLLCAVAIYHSQRSNAEEEVEKKVCVDDDNDTTLEIEEFLLLCLCSIASQANLLTNRCVA